MTKLVMQGPRIWEDYSPDSWPAKPNHDGQHFSVSNSSTSATAETKFALPSNFVMEALSGNTDPEVHSYLKDHQVCLWMRCFFAKLDPCIDACSPIRLEFVRLAMTQMMLMFVRFYCESDVK